MASEIKNPTQDIPRATASHVFVDAKGIARLVGRHTRVTEVVLEKLAYGWTPEEIQEQHPHLTLSQIYGAFAYYYDHKQELDAQIEQEEREIAQFREQMGQSPVVEKLRALGKLPSNPG